MYKYKSFWRDLNSGRKKNYQKMKKDAELAFSFKTVKLFKQNPLSRKTKSPSFKY